MRCPNCETEMIVGYYDKNLRSNKKEFLGKDFFKRSPQINLTPKRKIEYNAALCPKCNNLIFIQNLNE